MNIEIEKDEDGSIDEIVSKNCDIHIEKMEDGRYWIGVYPNGGGRLSMFINGNFEVEEEPELETYWTSNFSNCSITTG